MIDYLSEVLGPEPEWDRFEHRGPVTAPGAERAAANATRARRSPKPKPAPST
jgi:hypothetical protein